MQRPQIAEAKKVAERIGARAVVVLAFEGGRVSGASYGATKGICTSTGQFMDEIIDMLEGGQIRPPHD